MDPLIVLILGASSAALAAYPLHRLRLYMERKARERFQELYPSRSEVAKWDANGDAHKTDIENMNSEPPRAA